MKISNQTIGRKLLFSILLSIVISFVNAQDSKVKTAFASSIGFEAKLNYTSAIAKIMEVYSASSYEINLRLGWLNYCAGLQKESKQYYKIAIELMPFAIEAKFGYTYPLTALGDYDEIVNQYLTILRIDPNNTTALYALGMIYYNGKLYEKASKCFTLIANLYPFTYDSLHMLAWTNYKLGKTADAKQLFNRVLLISPSDASALEGLSLIK